MRDLFCPPARRSVGQTVFCCRCRIRERQPRHRRQRWGRALKASRASFPGREPWVLPAATLHALAPRKGATTDKGPLEVRIRGHRGNGIFQFRKNVGGGRNAVAGLTGLRRSPASGVLALARRRHSACASGARDTGDGRFARRITAAGPAPDGGPPTECIFVPEERPPSFRNYVGTFDLQKLVRRAMELGRQWTFELERESACDSSRRPAALRISGKLNARFGEVEQARREVLRSA